MKSFAFVVAAAGLLTSGIGLAQTSQRTDSTGTTPTTVSPHDQSNATASGNSNQAVATTSANAPTPAKGANSFTMGEAKSRLEKNGFSNVGGLTKDGDGVWRGNAQKAGSTTTVWLDYKGNAGEGK